MSPASPRCPLIEVEQIQHFFEHYKDLEPDKQVKVIEWVDGTEARQLIADAIAVNELIAIGGYSR